MFVRRKLNASGTSSVQVVMKERGRYVVVRSFGASADEQELSRLEVAARDFIRTYGGQRVIDFDARTAAEETRHLVSSVQSVTMNADSGPHL